MVSQRPDIAYTFTIRAQYPNRPGMLGTITSAIGREGGDIGAVDIVEVDREHIVRDITVSARNEDHAQQIVRAVKRIPGVRVVNVSDVVFLAHLGGKIEVRAKQRVATRADLSKVYTPGVGRVSRYIYEHPDAVWNLTGKGNTVAVVTDGSAVLGLGNLGPAAALPVMEGKAMLFKELAGVDAWPLCLATQDPEEIVETVCRVATGFGGINLEDISAPRCFLIEEELQRRLDIPVFHDDQHGTAVVVLAALMNALKIVGKDFPNLKVVILGVGASGTATARLLYRVGVRNIIGLDRRGTLHRGRTDLEGAPNKVWFVEHTNPDNIQGGLDEAVVGADVLIGLSGPGLIRPHHIQRMARDPIVFALANPVPEIWPEEAEPYARIIATGRSDYPNQVNNVLGFPGIFRGLLDVRACGINDEMKLAAARGIASIISPQELNEEYIIPSVFNRQVVRSVAREVALAAQRTGMARRSRRRLHLGSGVINA